MAQLEFTGKAMTFVHNGKTFGGLLRVTIDDQNAPLAEDLDVTVYGDAAYTYLTDPLGPKGSDKCTVTVVLQTSAESVDDTLEHAVAFNSAAAATFDLEPGTGNAQTWTHAALELTKRVTEIPFDAYATCTLTFEANSVGAWDSPA